MGFLLQLAWMVQKYYSLKCLAFQLFFFPFIFISWRLITLQCCSGFFHTLTWISHGFNHGIRFLSCKVCSVNSKVRSQQPVVWLGTSFGHDNDKADFYQQVFEAPCWAVFFVNPCFRRKQWFLPVYFAWVGSEVSRILLVIHLHKPLVPLKFPGVLRRHASEC